MDQIFLGSPLSAWLKALIAFVIAVLVLELLIYFNKKQSAKLLKPTLINDLISQLKWFTRVALPLWAGTTFLTLPQGLTETLRVLLITVLALQAGSWSEQFINQVADRELERTALDDLSKRSSIRGIAIASRVILWIVLILVILQSIPNFDIVSIVTSLGLGGIAIGLAAQSFVKDILSSLTIQLDKPFEIGDSIQTGSFSGSVENVGLRSTTLHNISGEDVSISNSTLLAEPIRNFSRMQDRFQSFSVLLAPDTEPEKIRELPALIEDVISKIDNIVFKRSRLKGFNPDSLELEVAYTVTTPDFTDFVTASHEINLAILELLHKKDIHMANPIFHTQSGIL